MKNITIGCDPEFVAIDAGIPISALSLTTGRKENPILLRKGKLLADNVNIEINVEPSAKFEVFESNFKSVILEAEQTVGHELHAIASICYPDNILENPEALAFGCNPDMNAFSLYLQFPPEVASLSTFRTTGGHIHLGMNSDEHDYLNDDMGKIRAIQMMDAVVGLPMVYVDTDPSAPDRRKLYGLAGSHRPTVYGVEYRALSSFWTRSPLLTKLVFLLSQAAVSIAKDKKLSQKILRSIGTDELQRAINVSNRGLCKELFDSNVAEYIEDPETLDVFANVTRDLDKFTNSHIISAWG